MVNRGCSAGILCNSQLWLGAAEEDFVAAII